MPWFRHHYYCESCDGSWLAEAELVIDGDCPFCGARDTAPYKSNDWTLVIEPARDKFVVLQLSKSARQQPDYCRRRTFATRAQAEAFAAILRAG